MSSLASIRASRKRPESETGKRPYRIPLIVVAVLCGGVILSLLFQDQSPSIKSISPRVGNPGEIMTIEGSYFGFDSSQAWVSISGQRVTASNIVEWTPQKISLRIPEGARSGSVTVQTPAGRSKATAFTNQNQIPRISQSTGSLIDAYLTSVSPSQAAPGDPIMLSGRNFGLSPGSLVVSVDGIPLPESDIFQWGPRGIGFWAPSWINEGRVSLGDRTGSSNAVKVTVRQDVAHLEISDSFAEYEVHLVYEIGDVQVRNPDEWGNITAYLPLPPYMLEQKVEETQIVSGESVFEAPPGMLVFSIDKPVRDRNYRAAAVWKIRRHSLRLRVDSEPVTGYTAFADLLKRYTGASPLVPSGEPAVKTFAAKTAGGEIRPLSRARAIYLAVVDLLSYDPDAGLAFAPEVLDDRKGNAFGYTNLLVGVWRAAGIPSRIVEGILLGKDDEVLSHFWAECFIPGIGWVQADPSLGDGLLREVIAETSDPRSFYFGNLDDRHIALIRGEGMTSLTRIDTNIQKLFQRFVLMQVHAESSGTIESYGLYIDSPRVVRIR